MTARRCAGALCLVTLLLNGCVNVALTRNPPRPWSPPPRTVAFSLRGSTILLGVAGSAVNDVNGSRPNLAATDDACKSAGNDRLSPSQCLERVVVLVRPTRTPGQIYWAQGSVGTSLTPSSLTGDPLLLKSIAVDYKNPASLIVQTASASAVTAFVTSGPNGAVAGTVVEVSVSQGQEKRLYDTMASLFVSCATNTGIRASAPTTLMLPVALPYPPVTTKGEQEGCWRPLPETGQNGSAFTSHWYYRFVPEEEPADGSFPPVIGKGLARASDPLDHLPDGIVTSDRIPQGRSTWMPVSACRAVALQIVPASQLNHASSVIDVKRIRLLVADPKYVQMMQLHKGSAINFFATCGAYESPGASIGMGDIANHILIQ